MIDNEKVRLEVLVTQKDEALAAVERRASIDREAWLESEAEKSTLMARIRTLEVKLAKQEQDWIDERNNVASLVKRNAELAAKVVRLTEDRSDMTEEAKRYYAALTNARNILIRTADGIEEAIR